jgi:hypothetical protein
MKKAVLCSSIVTLFMATGCTNTTTSNNLNVNDTTINALNSQRKTEEPNKSRIDTQGQGDGLKNKNSADELSELKKKYKHIRGVYYEFSFGDISHYMFKTESNEIVEFYGNNDPKIRLTVVSNNANGYPSPAINKKMKGKTFDVFYKEEKYEVDGWDPNNALDGLVIYKLIEVKNKK